MEHTDKNEKTVSRQTIYEEVWTDSAARIAKKYEISYSQFLKICKDNKIPIPPSGYWTKLEFHKPVERTPLPASEKDTILLFPEKRKPKDTAEVIAAESKPVSEEGKIGLVIPREGETPRYKRETLYREVWEAPMTDVCKRYGISDTGLRKICRKLDVPFPQAGYWAKVRAGKLVPKPDLPKLKLPPNEDKPKTGDRRTLHIAQTALSFLKEADRAKVLDAASKLRVAGPGAKLHKDIAKQKEKCESWLDRQKDNQMRYGRYAEEAPLLADSISKDSYARAFHILDALLKGMMPFGASVTYQFHFQVNGEDVPFTVSESRDQIPHEITRAEKLEQLKYEEAKRKNTWALKPNIPKWDRPWNGKLTLVVDGKCKFTDCTSYVLEDRIGEIMVAFYEASYANRLIRLENEEKQRKDEEARQKAAEVRERRNKEIDATEGLVNAAEDYAIACKIRAYIEAARKAGTKSAEWIAWASAKADWYDPTVCTKDPYFGVRDHEADAKRKTPEKKYW
ncbi:MAG: hypothetical protein E7426_05770 [Ruminococcaceae bacterium]|nr:hypothetical protein [Oscillospiraceae bacterium]